MQGLVRVHCILKCISSPLTTNLHSCFDDTIHWTYGKVRTKLSSIPLVPDTQCKMAWQCSNVRSQKCLNFQDFNPKHAYQEKKSIWSISRAYFLVLSLVAVVVVVVVVVVGVPHTLLSRQNFKLMSFL